MIRRPRRSTLFPYTTLSRPRLGHAAIERSDDGLQLLAGDRLRPAADPAAFAGGSQTGDDTFLDQGAFVLRERAEHLEQKLARGRRGDRKSTRLNSSHLVISYAVFCLKKKKKKNMTHVVLCKYADES